MKIKLGHDFEVDLETLIDTRLLIQANSGGGKSWAIRKLLEESHGKVHQIVLDIEGDFASLREKYDYIYAAKNGDINVSVKSAELLARKVLELRADIIIDLYELKQHERIKFVRLFLDAMINAPKELWHPALVVVDEAHIFAPEKGQAESMGAVNDLMTRGRKRGFCGVLATQRLSKLHKDAAAECNNKLIGRTSLDIDLKRATDELGMMPRDGFQLRNLAPGTFIVYGPAMSKTVATKVIGNVKTHHPSVGNRKLLHAPEPTAKVKSILSKLTDLPKEAEEELRDKEQLKQKVAELTHKIRVMEREKPKPELDQAGISKIKEATEKACLENFQMRFKDKFDFLEEQIKTGFKNLRLELQSKPFVGINAPKILAKSLPTSFQKPVTSPVLFSQASDDAKFGVCERKVLGFLLSRSDKWFTKIQVGAMTGYASGSGSFNNAISKLYQSGFIDRKGSDIQIRQDAIDKTIALVSDGFDYKIEDWIGKLGKCEKAIYEILLENPDVMFTKEELGEATSYQATSGSFNNSISRLNTLGLIQKSSDGIQINPEILNI